MGGEIRGRLAAIRIAARTRGAYDQDVRTECIVQGPGRPTDDRGPADSLHSVALWITRYEARLVKQITEEEIAHESAWRAWNAAPRLFAEACVAATPCSWFAIPSSLVLRDSLRLLAYLGLVFFRPRTITPLPRSQSKLLALRMLVQTRGSPERMDRKARDALRKLGGYRCHQPLSCLIVGRHAQLCRRQNTVHYAPIM